MLRISGGDLKNKKLVVGEGSRPIIEKVRLAMFNVLRDYVYDSDVLDLYAGSGVTGLEAISRGAKSCVFVDNSRSAINAIYDNIETCGLGDSEQLEVIKSSVYTFLLDDEFTQKFDLIILDPPYDQIKKIDLNLIGKKLKADGVICLRLPRDFLKNEKKKLIDDGAELVFNKNYGNSELVFYKIKEV